MARTLLLHAILHWPDETELDLWPFAMEHAVFVWNNLPNQEHGSAPIELWTGQLFENFDHLKHLHVFGCPAYVLEPTLQDGKKLPRWVARTRRGQYLGLAPDHASTVGRIRNLLTGHVSPQFHVVHDDWFTTVPNANDADGHDDLDLIDIEAIIQAKYSRDHFEVEDRDENGLPIPPPVLDDEWLTREETFQRRRIRERRGFLPRNNLDIPRPPRTRGGDVQATTVEPRGRQENDDPDVIDGYYDDSGAESVIEFDNLPPLGTLSDSDDSDSDSDGPNTPPQQCNGNPVRRSKRRRRPNSNTYGGKGGQANVARARVHDDKRVRFSETNCGFLNSLNWDDVTTVLGSDDYSRFASQVENEFEFHPMALMMKANAEDSPNYGQAMNGPEKDGYQHAMDMEIDILQEKEAWEEVDRTPEMNVLPSTWAFRCKRFPDGLIRKLKARFCVRGDCQKEGVDFFDTYAPVVSWTTVRLLLIISIVLGLATKQVDYTAAFVQAKLSEDEEVFVAMPRGYAKLGKVLKLKRATYGLKQSPHAWFEHLKDHLESSGFVQSKSDACLFYSDNVICLVYVDDCLLFAPDTKDIDDMFVKLRASGLDFNVEDDVAGFLGVLMKTHDDGSVELTQVGLIERVLTTLGLMAGRPKDTPAEYGALAENQDGDPCNENWNYASVVGMLMYLASNSRPDISFAVHQCTRFTHSPRHTHEVALKRIGRYLLGTKTKGLIMDPSESLGIEMYCDADFAGMHGYEHPENPMSVCSRTGYVICIAKCPVLWVSKLQPRTAMSTMMAEYIALSQGMRDLIPLK